MLIGEEKEAKFQTAEWDSVYDSVRSQFKKTSLAELEIGEWLKIKNLARLTICDYIILHYGLVPNAAGLDRVKTLLSDHPDYSVIASRLDAIQCNALSSRQAFMAAVIGAIYPNLNVTEDLLIELESAKNRKGRKGIDMSAGVLFKWVDSKGNEILVSPISAQTSKYGGVLAETNGAIEGDETALATAVRESGEELFGNIHCYSEDVGSMFNKVMDAIAVPAKIHVQHNVIGHSFLDAIKHLAGDALFTAKKNKGPEPSAYEKFVIIAEFTTDNAEQDGLMTQFLQEVQTNLRKRTNLYQAVCSLAFSKDDTAKKYNALKTMPAEVAQVIEQTPEVIEQTPEASKQQLIKTITDSKIKLDGAVDLPAVGRKVSDALTAIIVAADAEIKAIEDASVSEDEQKSSEASDAGQETPEEKKSKAIDAVKAKAIEQIMPMVYFLAEISEHNAVFQMPLEDAKLLFNTTYYGVGEKVKLKHELLDAKLLGDSDEVAKIERKLTVFEAVIEDALKNKAKLCYLGYYTMDSYDSGIIPGDPARKLDNNNPAENSGNNRFAQDGNPDPDSDLDLDDVLPADRFPDTRFSRSSQQLFSGSSSSSSSTNRQTSPRGNQGLFPEQELSSSSDEKDNKTTTNKDSCLRRWLGFGR